MAFEFINYEFNEKTAEGIFRYQNSGQNFTEKIQFEKNGKILDENDKSTLNRALKLAFLLIGTSYAKTWPSREVKLPFKIDDWQAHFLNAVYQDGLSQFAYENGLTREDLPHFAGSDNKKSDEKTATNYTGSGTLVLQSGGKDSLLNATLLSKNQENWSALYVGSSKNYPAVLDELGVNLQVIKRLLDMESLENAKSLGAKNGHVPVTFIIMSIALVQAILNGQNRIYTSIGKEGEEIHSVIKSTDEADLPVNHQWSKTKAAEDLFKEYVKKYISKNIEIGSPLRKFSELKIAQLFVKHCWKKYGHKFSSCNVANYRQQNDNRDLRWCGHCAKCANSYLLFCPWLEKEELVSLFDNDLFTVEDLWPEFKGLLSIDGEKKPFECIGEINELRFAYHHKKSGFANLPFTVPNSNFMIQ